MMKTRCGIDGIVDEDLAVVAEFQYSIKGQIIIMKSKSSGKEVNSISSFIDSLLSPPPLSNPLKRSSSQKNINDSITVSRENAAPQPKLPVYKLSPIKMKSKSEDKASQLFNNTKNYVEQISVENSMLISRVSSVTDSRTQGYSSNKAVKFRENIIARNAHYKRQFARKDSRTPSILKRSMLVRNSTIQFIQNSNIQSKLNSNVDRQGSNLAQDREGRASKTNQVVRKRYFTILERFQAKFSNKIKKGIKIRTEQKYKDELFPPILSSILRGGAKIQQAKSQKFKWMRLSEIYKEYPLVVTNDGNSNINCKCEHGSSFVADAFNCIRNCRSVLSKIFEGCQISDFGVYLVKIFQENVWKYVIVDDYVPVTENYRGQPQPYFVSCQRKDQSGPMEIWPYLLEKAYANYYANYESLHFGNTLDFLEEITGIPAEVFHYSSNEKKLADSNKRLQRLIDTEDTTFLGYVQSEGTYVPIQKTGQGFLKASRSTRSSALTMNLEHIYEYFDKIYALNPLYWNYSGVTTVGINIKKSGDSPRFDISVRTVKLSAPGTLSLSIRQKEKRFYQRSSLNYDYIWVRVILLQKEFDGDCRWIDGRYCNSKSINFSNKLEAGEYYILLLPQWKMSHCYELSLIANSNVGMVLGKKQYDDRDGLMQKGCCDLAQRYGKLHQINMFACNYSFIHEDLGLLIENINNQRYNGDIKINRSINGLKAAVDLIPFNIDFYQQKNNKLPYKTQISVYIQADKSYTVILMMRGGIDLPFLKKFDFGK